MGHNTASEKPISTQYDIFPLNNSQVEDTHKHTDTHTLTELKQSLCHASVPVFHMGVSAVAELRAEVSG